MKLLQIIIAVAAVAALVQLVVSYNYYTEILKKFKMIYDYLKTKQIEFY